jgi:hypothetical protein
MIRPRAILILLVLLVATAPDRAIAEPRDPAKAATQNTILFRKAVGHGELICTAGPDFDPAFLSDLVGSDAVDRVQAAYQIYIDWVVPDRPPLRIWSELASNYKHPIPGKKFLSLATTRPLPGERVTVLDMALVPEPENGLAPAYLLVAIRIRPGNAFTVYRISVWGSEVLRWWPSNNNWMAYAGITPQDPQAVTLSVSPDGRCSVAVTSERRHTVYEQLPGKWDFSKVKQWEDPEEIGRGTTRP